MRVVIGRIGKAHGIRGDVTVEVRTDEIDRRFAIGTTLLSTHATPLVIADARDHSGRLLLRFVGIDDRNGAEALRGTMLEADIDPTEKPTDEDEYYDRQLVGLAAVRVNGEVLGAVSEVVHLPGHDLLAITTPLRGEVLVPFVHEIVTEVDLLESRVIIDPPGGMFEDLED
jgi:16S rRNA processing protein RimM